MEQSKKKTVLPRLLLHRALSVYPTRDKSQKNWVTYNKAAFLWGLIYWP